MSQPFVYRTIELDGGHLRVAIRPGKADLPPLLVFNGIGANLELLFPFVRALDPDMEVIASTCLVSAAPPCRACLTGFLTWRNGFRACSTTWTLARST